MARISGDSLIVRGEKRSDNSWLFTIRYIAHFDQGELGLDFDDSVQISDGEGAVPVPFVACDSSVMRKKRVVVDDAALALMDGDDELVATVCLRRRDGVGVLTESTRLRRISARALGTSCAAGAQSGR